MGEPTNNIVVMKQCSFKDIDITGNYRLSLIASVRKGSKIKSIGPLLGLLSSDQNRAILDKLSIAHLLGERAVDLEAVNIEKVFWILCIKMHRYFWETLGLIKAKKALKWNLHFDLVLVNSEGKVVLRSTVLKWTVNNIKEFLKDSRRLRRSLTTQSIVNAISLEADDL